MKKYCFALSCLFACVSGSLLAQVNLPPTAVGQNTTTSISVTVSSAATIDSLTVIGSGGATDQDFTNAGGGSCMVGSSYTVGATCTVAVRFSPILTQIRYGAILLKDANGNVIGIANLAGNGVGPQVSFMPGFDKQIDYLPTSSGIATDGIGRVYVSYAAYDAGYPGPADPVNGGVHVLTPSGNNNYLLTTETNWTDPRKVWTDAAGNVYVYDTPDGIFADGQIYKNGVAILPGVHPSGLAGDAAGNLYLTDIETGTLVEEVLQAGTSNATPAYIQTAVSTSLGSQSVALRSMDAAGNLYLVDSSGVIHRETYNPNGSYLETFTSNLGGRVAIDGSGDIFGWVPGDHTFQLYRDTVQPSGSYLRVPVVSSVANPNLFGADGVGNFYHTDQNPFNVHLLYLTKEDFTAAPAFIFATTARGSISSDSPKVVTITNTGNGPLTFSNVTFPGDFSRASTSAGECSTGKQIALGASCTITIQYKPLSALPGSSSLQALNENIVVTTNSLNTASVRLISVSANETPGDISLPAPTFGSIKGGTYTSPVPVVISDSVADAMIYYTTDGSVPTTASIRYSGSIMVSATTTINAIAAKTGYSNSPVLSGTFVIQVPAATPVISPAGGVYGAVQLVTISAATPGSAIYYTTDGSIPTAGSKRYGSPIVVSTAQTVQAIATVPGYLHSAVASQSYVVVGSPTALAYPATAVSTPKAALHAIVNTQGVVGSYVFQYGTTATALTLNTKPVALSATTNAVNVNAALTTLSSGTTYYFNVVVTTAGGSATSAVQSFTTN